jgi:hypothetical protein
MLRRRSWRHVGSELYSWTGQHEDAWQRLHAWHRRLPRAIFTGLSAAWLHRLHVDPLHPVEIAVPPGSGIRSRPGLVVSRRVITETMKVGAPRGWSTPSAGPGRPPGRQQQVRGSLISTTQRRGSSSSTTGPTIATDSSRTTAARTSCSMPAIGCCDSRPPTSTSGPTWLRRRLVRL